MTGRHPFLDNLNSVNMDFSRFAGLLGQIINFSYTMQFVVIIPAAFFLDSFPLEVDDSRPLVGSNSFVSVSRVGANT